MATPLKPEFSGNHGQTGKFVGCHPEIVSLNLTSISVSDSS